MRMFERNLERIAAFLCFLTGLSAGFVSEINKPNPVGYLIGYILAMGIICGTRHNSDDRVNMALGVFCGTTAAHYLKENIVPEVTHKI